MYIHQYKLQDKNDYPVWNPTCGIYVLQSECNARTDSSKEKLFIGHLKHSKV